MFPLALWEYDIILYLSRSRHDFKYWELASSLESNSTKSSSIAKKTEFLDAEKYDHPKCYTHIDGLEAVIISRYHWDRIKLHGDTLKSLGMMHRVFQLHSAGKSRRDGMWKDWGLIIMFRSWQHGNSISIIIPGLNLQPSQSSVYVYSNGIWTSRLWCSRFMVL